MTRLQTLLIWCVSAALPCTLAGCGDGGPPRYHISGVVTFDGQPVPAGAISFIPVGETDVPRGPGFCRFTEGNYESRSGRSPGSGPYRVLIDGYDGVPFEVKLGEEIEEHPMGKPIFPTHIVEVDLPPEHGGSFDFEIPAAESGRLRARR
jgi:hypothetical protein